jgi:hypothetical protein
MFFTDEAKESTQPLSIELGESDCFSRKTMKDLYSPSYKQYWNFNVIFVLMVSTQNIRKGLKIQNDAWVNLFV